MAAVSRRCGFRLIACLFLSATPVRFAFASEAGQGTFHTTLAEHSVHCNVGSPITTTYTSDFLFSDKTFQVNLPPGNNQLAINFSLLGDFHADGTLDCVFDEGGTFEETATNEAGDFTFTTLGGEYMDRVPGVAIGDPFPFVGTGRCATTREDDFRTLCENFEFSFNGLGKALEPEPDGAFHNFAGNFTLRAAPLAPVAAKPGPETINAPVDGQSGGDIPDIDVTLFAGASGAGEIAVATLAEAHGTLPSGMELPVRGTTEIDHGSGPEPFFAGGDQRFVNVAIRAPLPTGTGVEVCLPTPMTTSAAETRPVHLLHAEGTSPSSRKFVDRTSRMDVLRAKVCALVADAGSFAVATHDHCGRRGGSRGDGLLTLAGGIVGAKSVVVDGLADCRNFPSSLPGKLAALCLPDAGGVDGQCTLELVVGVNRAGCNRMSSSAEAYSAAVDAGSYRGTLKGRAGILDLTPVVGPLVAALGSSAREATLGPVEIVLPTVGRTAKYRLVHELVGAMPGDASRTTRDRDVTTVLCIDPAAF